MIRLNEIKTCGTVVPSGGALWLTHSLSGVCFAVSGAHRLRLRLRTDGNVSRPEAEPTRPRYAVLLDGKTAADARMEREEETVSVFEAGDGRERTVRLVKLSECTQSLMALAGIETDGSLRPLPEKALKIEFIGDSITCGYGVEGQAEEPFTTATENAMKSYAALAAEALDADACLTAYSGHGIVSAYTDDPAVRNTDGLVPLFYGKAGRNGKRLPDGRLAEEIDRDFSGWQPQYIVINLGTNDLSWCEGYPERKELFRQEYARFLKTVRKHNPEARILCTLGVMGTGLNRAMELAAEDYTRETGDTRIRVLGVEEQDMARDGAGSDWHPSETTQRLYAGKVTEAIREWRKE